MIYEYNVDIKPLTFEICLIHKPTHKPTLILIILINDSNDLKIFTVLVVVAFTEEEIRKRQRQQANTKPATEYCRVRSYANHT